MWATLRQRNFALLWVAGLVSISGNWMLFVALPVLVYTMTGSALAVGGMLLAKTVPGILFGSLAGVFVDRWERRRTMVIVNLLLALSILPLLLVRSADWLWLVYVVCFVQSTLNQFFTPAENAFLPLLSDPKLLVSANALNALNNNLARLIGPAIGGLVAAWFGVGGVVVVDVLTYVVAAVLVALISVTSHPGKVEGAENRFSFRKLVDEWLEGLRLIWRDRRIRVLFILNTIPAIGESIMYVLFVPFVTEILRGDTVQVGGLMSAQAVGGVVGGMVISRVAPRIKTYRLLGYGMIGIALCDFVLFNYFHFVSGVALGYVMFILAGPASITIGAGYQTLFQENIEDKYRGRIFGTFSVTFSLFTLVGIGVIGVAHEHFGIVPMLNLDVAGYALAGVLALLLLRDRAVREVMAHATTSAVQPSVAGAEEPQLKVES
jgi:predicted MFS family arabinose efflux permease